MTCFSIFTEVLKLRVSSIELEIICPEHSQGIHITTAMGGTIVLRIRIWGTTPKGPRYSNGGCLGSFVFGTETVILGRY